MKTFVKLALLGAGIFAFGQMLKPRKDKFDKIKEVMQTDFAYRGYYNNKDIPENSIPAFKRAIDNKKGVFTNLILTQDNVPVLIARDNVTKMLGKSIDIESLNYDELSDFKLLNTGCNIPTLSELFELVAGKVPIYIRIERYKKHCASTILDSVCALLDNYDGEVIFDTSEEKLLKKRFLQRPDLIFGKVLSARTKNGISNDILANFLKRHLLTNSITAPDFISCQFSDRRAKALNWCRDIYGIPVFYWPIRSFDEYNIASDDGAGIIACEY